MSRTVRSLSITVMVVESSWIRRGVELDPSWSRIGFVGQSLFTSTLKTLVIEDEVDSVRIHVGDFEETSELFLAEC